MTAFHAILTDVIGLLRFEGIIPGKESCVSCPYKKHGSGARKNMRKKDMLQWNYAASPD